MDSMVQLLSSKRVIQVTDKFWPGNGGIGASWFGVILKPRTSAFFPSQSSITARCCTLCYDRLSYNQQKYIVYAILKTDIC